MLRRVLSRVVVLIVLTLLARPAVVSATSITFDLRDPSIETFDEVNSFPLTQSGLTAPLTALPSTFK
jgi:hypothetical protein